MSRVLLSEDKTIRLDQLAAEIGVPVTLVEEATGRWIVADTDDATLQAAIDAHVAQPIPTPPDPIQMVDDTKTDLQAQIDQLTDITLGI